MGTGRLKHFCELCRKQCKDQNGFKCHLNSASHNLRVRDFATNPLQHIEKASRQFQGRFIQLVKTKYAGEPKYLQELYNELMEEKKFLKFNHTQWKNLAEFGNYLREVRNIQVIGVPPNCKILYLVNKTKDFIDAAKKQKQQSDREKQKQQFQKSIGARIQREKQIAAQKQEELNIHLASLQEQQKHMSIPDRLQFNISGFNQDNKRSAFYSVEELEKQYKEEVPFYQKKLDNIERLYNELKKKDRGNEEEENEVEWIHPGITVRIKPHQIDPAFHNKKCKIVRVVEPFVAEVAVGTALIEIDQTNLETVIPKIGNKIMILHDKHIGEIGVMTEANISEGYGMVEVNQQKIEISFNFISRFDE